MTNSNTDQQVGPYAASAAIYRERGWAGVLPVVGKNGNLPVDFTGQRNGYVVPSDDQVQRWVRDRPRDNVGLRLPRDVDGYDVVSFDVDCWGGKTGQRTIDELTVQLGDIGPAFYCTARTDGSRRLFFRVPAGRKWSDVGGDVETLWWGHRFAVVWPSVHPEVERVTYWYDPVDRRLELPPLIGELTVMPTDWVERFSWPWLAPRQRTGGDSTAVAHWTDPSSGQKVDQEAICRGDYEEHGTQRNALVVLVRSGWAYNVPRVALEAMCTVAITNFPQTKPEPWTSEDVHRLIESTTEVPPGKSVDFTGEVTTPEQLAWARSLCGINDDDPVADAFNELVNKEAAQLQVRRIAQRIVTERELAGARGPRVVRSAREFADQPSPELVIADVLAAEVNLLAGPSEAGKSLLARDWALAVASGEDWRDHKVPDARPVLWIASEGTHDFGERWRVQPLWEAAADNVHMLDEPINLLSESDVTWLLDECADLRPGLVVFDVIYGMGLADDNGTKDVVPLIASLKRISAAWTAATLAVCHPGHGDQRRVRGSSAWRQLAAVEWHMADHRLSCEKSKIANKNQLAWGYEVDYPALRWRGTDTPLGAAMQRAANEHRELEQRIIEAIRAFGPTSKTNIYGVVGGRKQTIMDTIELLLSEDQPRVQKDATGRLIWVGSGGS